MTLGRLLELIEAQKNGKQIMAHVINNGHRDNYSKEVNILHYQLSDLIDDEKERPDGSTEILYIKGVENEWGDKCELP